VLAPLPRLYRLIVLASLLAVCIVAGISLARYYDLPLGGLLVGSAAGVLLAFATLHDFHRRNSSRVPHRH
jgi:ABC-type Mn2+/Zn2+ transport system permease subunit